MFEPAPVCIKFFFHYSKNGIKYGTNQQNHFSRLMTENLLILIDEP